MSEKKKPHPIAALLGLAVGVVVAFVGFSSCGSHHQESSAQPSTSTTVDRAAVESAVRSNTDAMDLLYIGTLDKDSIPYANKEGAIALAHTICSDLDSGTSATDVATKLAAVNSVYTNEQLGELMGAAVQAYCPAHVPELGN
ncbi:DUF732 domain-containing protein [Nocardia sp. NPDC088792]|uniref:DUF732 domain-containing protein n=1 Tax=Nocardia sp. NPDC088792 TaxID=3364332 RepID=UPI00382ED2E9